MRIGPFGVWEIMIILIVVLLIFGPRRLPEMAKGLGQSVRAFRKEMRDIKEDFNTDDWADTPGPRRGVSPVTSDEARAARTPASHDPAPREAAPHEAAPVDAAPSQEAQANEAGDAPASEKKTA